MHVFMCVMGDLKGLKGLWQRPYGTLFLSRTIFSVFSPCHEKKKAKLLLTPSLLLLLIKLVSHANFRITSYYRETPTLSYKGPFNLMA